MIFRIYFPVMPECTLDHQYFVNALKNWLTTNQLCSNFCSCCHLWSERRTYLSTTYTADSKSSLKQENSDVYVRPRTNGKKEEERGKKIMEQNRPEAGFFSRCSRCRHELWSQISACWSHKYVSSFMYKLLYKLCKIYICSWIWTRARSRHDL